jgi:benzoyl-CoA reductase/2-hydroxyglutaryl-CoA dehydratase subunit BcrC/BadD/HgdB
LTSSPPDSIVFINPARICGQLFCRMVNMVTNEKRSKFERLVRSCRMIQKMNRSRPDVTRSEMLYLELLTGYFTNILEASREKRPLVLHTIFMPAEILYAMDIVPLHAETTSWMVPAFSGNVGELIAKAGEMGLAPEICSAHRVMAGAYAAGDMPRPDAILWSSLSCDNSVKSGELLVRLNDCPGFFADIPFNTSPAEISYCAGEFNEMIGFLEKTTGKKMDWTRLAEIVSRLNRQIDLYREIYELRKAVPSPFPMHRFTELFMSLYLFPGHPGAITYLETLRDELTALVKSGKGAAENERFRLMSLFMPPAYMMGLLGEISRESGAVSVVEPLFCNWGEERLDPSKPLESLALKSFLFPESATYSSLDDRILKGTLRAARDFKVDGAVFYAHVGCRQGSGLIKTYKDLLNSIDVPMLTLDLDLLDETVTSPEEVRSRMGEFLEILADR